MPIKINGSTSGYTEIKAADTAANNTLTLPSASGTLMTTGGSNTFTSNQIIEVTDNTNAALRITQLGTGEAIRVEDSTNPDSTPFVVDASGNVGIGKSPSYKLDVAAQANLNGVTIGANGDTVNGSSGLLAIQTGGTERMRIDSSGNVGIGTSAINYRLDVYRGSTNGSVAQFTGNNLGRGLLISTSQTSFADDTAILNAQMAGSGQMVLQTGGSERMRIDSSGNVGIGTGSPAYKLDVSATGTSIASAIRTNQTEAYIALKDSGTTIGNVRLGSSSNAMVMLAGGSERMRIDSAGGVGIGTTNGDPTANRVNGMYITQNGRLYARANGSWDMGRDGTTGVHISFYTDNGSARVTAGNISSNGSTTAYNTTSDYRLKENVQPLQGAITTVSQLRPVTFTWKEGYGGTSAGAKSFLAHELQEVFPDAVTGEKDAVDEDGNPVYQSVDQSKLVPLLTAALQEALKEISDLKTRMAALEGGAA